MRQVEVSQPVQPVGEIKVRRGLETYGGKGESLSRTSAATARSGNRTTRELTTHVSSS
jgi:hypothetical protein